MKLIKAVMFILMAVIALPAFAEEPKPLGIALGTPLDEVKRALTDRPFQDNGVTGVSGVSPSNADWHFGQKSRSPLRSRATG